MSVTSSVGSLLGSWHGLSPPEWHGIGGVVTSPGRSSETASRARDARSARASHWGSRCSAVGAARGAALAEG
eukprot:5642147-Prymnesium_polylepis.1